jgi:hypothetical protein
MAKQKKCCTDACSARLNKVGGQAVIEGVMMKAGERTVTTCRKEDKSLVVYDGKFVSVRKKHKFLNIQILRGVINFIEMIKLKDMTNGDMNILNGEDFILLPSLAAGADAGVGATYNVMLPEFVSIYKDFKAGRLDAALETQRKVNRVAEFLCNNEVIPSVKLAMKLLGNDVGAATFPLRQFTSEEEATFEREIRALGWPFK